MMNNQIQLWAQRDNILLRRFELLLRCSGTCCSRDCVVSTRFVSAARYFHYSQFFIVPLQPLTTHRQVTFLFALY